MRLRGENVEARRKCLKLEKIVYGTRGRSAQRK